MNHLQPNDSLKIIQNVINQRKRKYEQNGFFFIFWGVLIALAGISHFVMLKFNLYAEKSGLIWAILMPLGSVFTFIFKMKEGIRAEKQGKSTDWHDWIWLVAGIGAMAYAFIRPDFQYLIIVIYLPFAMATLSTAFQLKNQLWIGTSLISIVLIYSTLFINYGIYLTLVSAVLGVLLFLIPGVKLHLDYKKRNP